MHLLSSCEFGVKTHPPALILVPSKIEIDARKTVGGRVTAKAIHITNESKCKQWYGTNAKTKWLICVVSQMQHECLDHPGARGSTFVEVSQRLENSTYVQ